MPNRPPKACGLAILQWLIVKAGAYWRLIKSLQTGLLLVTGVAGYESARCSMTAWQTFLGMMGSLFLAISGSTVLNMVLDRDLDARMYRTCWRPLPLGTVSVNEALVLGLVLSVLGGGWALALGLAYGGVVLTGWFFDVVIYTFWLKRRTPLSILFGGIAGGMPVLAGRTLGIGSIDLVGLLLALAVLLWIPTHILTFSIKYAEDYRRAGIPTFPTVYRIDITRKVITISTTAAVLTMFVAAILVGMTSGCLRLLAVFGVTLVGLAAVSMARPAPKLNFLLFKSASLYMLASMSLIAVGTRL